MSEPATGAVIDGFGRRTRGIDPDTGEEAELLELSSTLVEHAGFVSALGDRVARFATVRHGSYVHLRRLDRPSADRLVLVSDDPGGWRLSELLTASAAAGSPLDIAVVIGLLRQLLPAAALFSRHNRDSAIGALSPERLIVTPQGRLVIAEHAFGPAIEKLNLGRDRLWRDFRVTMPPSAGLPRANARADANALGIVALSLLLGRLLTEEEYPNELPALLDSAVEHRSGEVTPLSKALSTWLTRSLQFDISTSFQSPHEAQVAFESVLATDRSYVTSSSAVDEWVTRIGGQLTRSRAPAESGKRAPKPIVPEPESAEFASAVPPATRSPLVPVLAVLSVLLVAVVLWLWSNDPGGPRAGEGELVVESRPAAARVVVDGKERGVTPITLSLAAGAHVLEVQIGKSEPRVIPLTIRAGVQTAQYVELQNVPTTGGLEIRSEPPGARVTVDGQNRGTTPLTIRDLPPGAHTVVLEAGGRKVTQPVRIDAGITAQLVVPLPRR